jgi:hypothetical protein
MKRSFLDGTTEPQNVVKAFAELLGQYMAEDVKKTQTVGNPIGPYIYGPGGLFGMRGLEREIISTHTQILGSVAETLSISPSQDINPLFAYITGFLRSDQSEKNAVCDNPKDVGNMKTCIQTTLFGRKEFKTRQLEINKVGQRTNRGEFQDLQIINGPLAEQMGGLMRDFGGFQGQNAILAGREMVMRMVEVGVAYQRWLCPAIYTGNPSNNSAGGGYKEFPGLDLLISRTKVDAETGQACPSLYSDIKNFSYRQVDSATDPDIVRTITTMMRILKSKARKQGLAPVDIRMAMRDELFYALTEVWPCRYISYRCSTIDPATGLTGTISSLSAEGAVAMKNQMRDGAFLWVDNVKVPVIIDDCIAEDNHADNGTIPAGCFASDIYFLPYTARGGTIRTLYMEYYDYRDAVLPAANDAHALPIFFWSDGGVFLWGLKAPDNWCLEAISKTEPRLILRTPQLAGRLQHIAYCPLQHTDDPLPSQDYFVNGGVTTGRPGPSPYAEWNLSGPGIQP